MITIKSEREFAKMAKAGACVAATHRAVKEAAVPGVTMLELDRIAAGVIASHGCTPSFLDYRGTYPATICTSPNEIVVHGIPGEYRLKVGDLLSIDAGAIYEGFHGDAAFTIGVGAVSAKAAALLTATEEGMWAGVRAVAAGARLGDVSAAVQAVGDAGGYGIVREYVGHGIGRQMHEDPQIPNVGNAGSGLRLRTGMALCIEPMFNLGTWETVLDPDGWTVRTADGSLSAHFEHTVAITKRGVMIFTAADVPVDLVEMSTNG